MGGAWFTKLGAALTVIFVVSFVVLFAELYYFLWRRRVFSQNTNYPVGGVVGGDRLTQSSVPGTALSSSLPSSKELLYFFCLRSNSRLHRNSMSTPTISTSDLNSKQQSDVEVIDVDTLKIHSVFGPPRFLFTIKEEEAEDLDSPAEQKEGKKNIDHDSEALRAVSLEEVEEPAVVAVEIDGATTFSTPCASPTYFTPSSSPAREAVNVWSTGPVTNAGSLSIHHEYA